MVTRTVFSDILGGKDISCFLYDRNKYDTVDVSAKSL